MFRMITLSIALSVSLTGLVRAQQDAPLSVTDSSVHKLDAIVSRMAAYLRFQSSYRVTATQQWKLNGKHATEGVNVYELTVRAPDNFRVEVDSQSDGPRGTLICVSDGEMITRLFSLDDDSVYSQRSGGLNDLLKDAMTEGTLRESLLGLVSRSDLHDYLMTTATRGSSEKFNARWVYRLCPHAISVPDHLSPTIFAFYIQNSCQ